jgi:ribosome biogenesis GTPase / thiamine phosphate phosphatase
MNKLETLGYTRFFEKQHKELLKQDAVRPDLKPARVLSDRRDTYLIGGVNASIAELSGNMLHRLSAEERPVAGDWTLVDDSHDRAIIHHVFERKTALKRRATGSEHTRQLLAANVDTFFIVTAASSDLNERRLERRLERYLTLVWDSGAEPVIVLNKVDLVEDATSLVDLIANVAFDVPILPVSAERGDGVERMHAYLDEGQTTALIGSSGVGKSSIINQLLGEARQSIKEVHTTGEGRHATSQRELIELPEGGMLLDTPGMRELGMVDAEAGLHSSFADIAALAVDCRFRDCKHVNEPGCAVIAAVDAGDLESARLDSFRKLQKEAAYMERQEDPVHAANAKQRWKGITKNWKSVTKQMGDDSKFKDQ